MFLNLLDPIRYEDVKSPGFVGYIAKNNLTVGPENLFHVFILLLQLSAILYRYHRCCYF